MPERNFQIGVVQMSCTPEPEQNLERAIAHVRERGQAGRRDRLPARTVSRRSISASAKTSRCSIWPSRFPGPTTKRLGEVARELKITIDRVAVRAPRAGPLSQHRRHHRLRTASWTASTARCTSPTTRCTTRSSTSRRAISGSRAFETDFGKFGTLVCWDQWYPEGARLTALQGANVLFYPDGDRLASRREGAVRRSAVRCLAHHSARARHRQRSVCRRAQSRRLRDRQHSRQRSAGQGPGVLGRLVHRRSLRAGDRAGVARQRRDAGRRGRPASAWKTCAATGRSGAIAAWTPMRSRSGSRRRFP